MSPPKKYLSLLSAILFAFLYLLATEVLGRWGEALDLHDQVAAKENEVLDPEGIAARRMQLLERQTDLTGRVVNGDARFEQSMTGVYEFLTKCAASTGVRIVSLVPAQNESEGQITGLGFKITANAEFHKACAFIGAMESGSLAVSLRRVHYALERKGSSRLLAEIEGVAYVLSTEIRQ